MTDERTQVLELERRRCEAIGAGDLQALGEVLADDYIHLFGTGATCDKAEYISHIEAGPRVPIRNEILVRMYGDVAVLTGDLINNLNLPGQEPRVIEAACSQVAVKRSGRWQFVSIHLTPKREV